MEIINRYVYEIENLVNGKTYIGQKKCLDGKTPETDNYFGSGKYLKNAINKYGITNFTKRILVFGQFTKNEIDEFERYYISLYRLGGKAEYNIADGGNGGDLGKLVNQQISKSLKNSEKHKRASKQRIGKTVSEETRKKISEARMGKKGHPQTEYQKRVMRERMSGKNNPMYGKPRSEETRKKIGEASKGRKQSDESKQKKSESHKRYWENNDELRQKYREANLGEKNPNFGKHCIHSDETKEKMTQIKKEYWSNNEKRKEQSERVRAWWTKRKQIKSQSETLAI